MWLPFSLFNRILEMIIKNFVMSKPELSNQEKNLDSRAVLSKTAQGGKKLRRKSHRRQRLGGREGSGPISLTPPDRKEKIFIPIPLTPRGAGGAEARAKKCFTDFAYKTRVFSPGAFKNIFFSKKLYRHHILTY